MTDEVKYKVELDPYCIVAPVTEGSSVIFNVSKALGGGFISTEGRDAEIKNSSPENRLGCCVGIYRKRGDFGQPNDKLEELERGLTYALWSADKDTERGMIEEEGHFKWPDYETGATDSHIWTANKDYVDSLYADSQKGSNKEIKKISDEQLARIFFVFRQNHGGLAFDLGGTASGLLMDSGLKVRLDQDPRAIHLYEIKDDVCFVDMNFDFYERKSSTAGTNTPIKVTIKCGIPLDITKPIIFNTPISISGLTEANKKALCESEVLKDMTKTSKGDVTTVSYPAVDQQKKNLQALKSYAQTLPNSVQGKKDTKKIEKFCTAVEDCLTKVPTFFANEQCNDLEANLEKAYKNVQPVFKRHPRIGDIILNVVLSLITLGIVNLITKAATGKFIPINPLEKKDAVAQEQAKYNYNSPL